MGVALSDDDLKWGGTDSPLRFDFVRRVITSADDPFVKQRILTFKGGVLADQMVCTSELSQSLSTYLVRLSL